MTNIQSILVLYTELAAYTIKCFEILTEKHSVEVHIIRKPINKDAPFNIKLENPHIRLYSYDDLDENKLVDLFNVVKPGLIYCAGWSDKKYLNFCKNNHSKCKTLIGFDNQWNGTLKQIIGLVYARLFISPYFDFAFVPGNRQKIFAKMIGFKKNQIHTGAYSADVSLYNSIYQHRKTKPLTKTIFFAGRYVKEKGIDLLCETFMELSKNELKDWKLICIGAGSYQIPKHEKIIDKGFLQPNKMAEAMIEGSVFVLPSLFEPWGVVIHEYVSAGYPIICTNNVGASDIFVQHNANGYIIDAHSKRQLELALKKIVSLDKLEYDKMSRLSYELSQKITPEKWSNTLNQLLNA